jgi:hypothetical protein
MKHIGQHVAQRKVVLTKKTVVTTIKLVLETNKQTKQTNKTLVSGIFRGGHRGPAPKFTI